MANDFKSVSVYYPRLRMLTTAMFGLMIGVGAGATTLIGFRPVIKSAFDQAVQTKVVQLDKTQVIEIPKIITTDKVVEVTKEVPKIVQTDRVVEVPKIVEVTKEVIPKEYTQPVRDVKMYSFTLFGVPNKAPKRELYRTYNVTAITIKELRHGSMWIGMDTVEGGSISVENHLCRIQCVSDDHPSKLYCYRITQPSEDGSSIATSKEYVLEVHKDGFDWLSARD